MRVGFAGRVAHAFLDSKLTPLIIAASLGLGALALLATPREEEPQIRVPMVDVMVAWPGAEPAEVENRIVAPIERILWGVPGVEHIYSVSRPGMGMVTVRFKVNESNEDSLVKVYERQSAMGWIMPQGTLPPIVELHSIDDVPFLTPHAVGRGLVERPAAAARPPSWRRSSPRSRGDEPRAGDRRPAAGRARRARPRPHGGGRHQLDAAHGRAAGRVGAAGGRHGGAGQPRDPGRGRAALPELRGGRSGRGGRPRRAARSTSPRSRGSWTGPTRRATRSSSRRARRRHGARAPAGSEQQAVTIAIAKRTGANATELADRVLRKVAELRPRLLPAEIQVEVTRNYGETAREKSNELVEHLLIATLSVVALISLAMGWRSGLVVGIAVPVTLALTLFIYYVAGYTLNRVTLFALIFSIGILVDDAIVVVENIERHHREKRGLPFAQDRDRGDRRGGQPDDPRHLHRDRRDPADGLRARDDGPLHEPDPDGGLGGDAVLAGGGLHGHAVGGGAHLPPPRRARPRRGGRRAGPPGSTAGSCRRS